MRLGQWGLFCLCDRQLDKLNYGETGPSEESECAEILDATSVLEGFQVTCNVRLQSALHLRSGLTVHVVYNPQWWFPQPHVA